MKITTVNFGKTFNLGDFESERIDMTAELGEEDTPEGVLESLRELVCSSSGVDAVVTSLPASSLPPYYSLYRSDGIVALTFETAREWLQTYDEKLSGAADVRAYVTHNATEFARIKDKAVGNESPRALQAVQRVEERVRSMLK